MKKRKKTLMRSTRVPFDIAAMIAAIGWHQEKCAADVLAPMVRLMLKTEYDALPEIVRERFPTTKRRK